jgi:hypothetical protein
VIGDVKQRSVSRGVSIGVQFDIIEIRVESLAYILRETGDLLIAPTVRAEETAGETPIVDVESGCEIVDAESLSQSRHVDLEGG